MVSRASVVHDSSPLQPALLALGDGSPSKIIPRISRGQGIALPSAYMITE
jgi:hypothetical protein